MRVLKKGLTGKDVENWQSFLRGEDLYHGVIDGDFGDATLSATKEFQHNSDLDPDGVVGRITIGTAMTFGFVFGEFEGEDENFPPLPSFKPLSNKGRNKLFGTFEFVSTPTERNKEKIKITDDWADDNIIMVDIPELAKATGGKYTRMRLHKLIANQTKMMFKEWDDKGLLHLILTYSGAFYPRFIRGSRKNLSNHSWGTAIDFNVAWNRLGKVPALKGQKGSVRELVAIANKWGFFWGGHFKNRKDGMHFEAAFIVK